MSPAVASVHDFEFILTGADELTEEIIDAIYEAGCDDASLGSCGSALYLAFHREAASYDEAVASARADVARASLGLTVERVVRFTTFSFHVVVAGAPAEEAALTEALVRGGCDDATPRACGESVALHFGRLDKSLGAAIGRAVENVARAGFAVARVEVDR